MRCSALAAALEEKAYDTRILVDARLPSELPRVEVVQWHDEIEGILGRGATVCVVDSYNVNETFCEVLAGSCPSVFIDDFARIRYPPGLIINSGVGAHEFMYHGHASWTLLLGPRYALLRKPFWDLVAPALREEASNILITMGGEDVGRLSARVMRATRRIFEGPMIVLAGSRWPHLTEIHDCADKTTEILCDLDSDGMLSLLNRCDSAITAGGQTTYELARFGIPMILIETADNQHLNCVGWQRSGSNFAGIASDPRLDENLIRLLPRVLAGPKRTEQSVQLKDQVDGQGARRCASAVMKWIESGSYDH